MDSNKKRKICVVITNRAQYGRYKHILTELKNNPRIELQIIVGASALLDKYGSIIEDIEKDGFHVDIKLTMSVEGGSPISMAKTTGLGIIEFSSALENLNPDIVLVRGDRFEVLAAAIAAAYMNIVVAHIEGGDVSGSIDESVRHSITKLAHIHFPTNEEAYNRLIKMGENSENIFLVGSPDIEFIRKIKTTPLENLFDRYGGIGESLDLKDKYLVVLQHPVTSEYEEGIKQIEETLHAVEDLDIPTIWIWPNTDAGTEHIAKGIRKFREFNNTDNIHFFRNLAPEDYIRLISNCACLVGNSSSGIKEGSHLGIPVVNIGTRQKGRLREHNVVDAVYDKEEIKNKIKSQANHGPYKTKNIYSADNEPSKIISKILSECELNTQKKICY